MNPRIQVEHTVTEVITGIDLVRSQILIADGKPIARPGTRHCRRRKTFRATATPCNAASPPRTRKTSFTPDYGRILTYRSAGGFGIRLDGGMGYGGAVITPFYDSLLVKLTACGADVRHARCSAWTARCASSAFAA